MAAVRRFFMLCALRASASFLLLRASSSPLAAWTSELACFSCFAPSLVVVLRSLSFARLVGDCCAIAPILAAFSLHVGVFADAKLSYERAGGA